MHLISITSTKARSRRGYSWSARQTRLCLRCGFESLRSDRLYINICSGEREPCVYTSKCKHQGVEEKLNLVRAKLISSTTCFLLLVGYQSTTDCCYRWRGNEKLLRDLVGCRPAPRKDEVDKSNGHSGQKCLNPSSSPSEFASLVCVCVFRSIYSGAGT